MDWNLTTFTGYDFLELALDLSNDSYDFSKIMHTVHNYILKAIEER